MNEFDADAILEMMVSFGGELKRPLEKRDCSPALMLAHLNILDQNVGKVNNSENGGRLFGDPVVSCMGVVYSLAQSFSFMICSFHPNLGEVVRVARIAMRDMTGFIQPLISL